MDLEEILAVVTKKVDEAGRAFHAGHRDTSRLYLKDTLTRLGIYFNAEPDIELKDVTKAGQTEQSGKQTEQPAQVPDAAKIPPEARPGFVPQPQPGH